MQEQAEPVVAGVAEAVADALGRGDHQVDGFGGCVADDAVDRRRRGSSGATDPGCVRAGPAPGPRSRRSAPPARAAGARPGLCPVHGRAGAGPPAAIHAAATWPPLSPASTPVGNRSQARSVRCPAPRRSTRQIPYNGSPACPRWPWMSWVDPAADVVEAGEPEGDDVEALRHPGGVGQNQAQSSGVPPERIERPRPPQHWPATARTGLRSRCRPHRAKTVPDRPGITSSSSEVRTSTTPVTNPARPLRCAGGRWPAGTPSRPPPAR